MKRRGFFKFVGTVLLCDVMAVLGWPEPKNKYTKKWRGLRGNWEDPAMWEPHGVPCPRDDVLLDKGVVRFCLLAQAVTAPILQVYHI